MEPNGKASLPHTPQPFALTADAWGRLVLIDAEGRAAAHAWRLCQHHGGKCADVKQNATAHRCPRPKGNRYCRY